MLAAVSSFVAQGKPVVRRFLLRTPPAHQAAICHGPWMLCSARDTSGKPVVAGRRCTGFFAIKDDIINAGATWVDEPVVVDGNLITSRTPNDLSRFCHAIIAALK